MLKLVLLQTRAGLTCDSKIIIIIRETQMGSVRFLVIRIRSVHTKLWTTDHDQQPVIKLSSISFCIHYA